MEDNMIALDLSKLSVLYHHMAQLVNWIDTHKSSWKYRIKSYDHKSVYPAFDEGKSYSIHSIEFSFKNRKVQVDCNDIGLRAYFPKDIFGKEFQNEDKFWNNVLDCLRETEDGNESRNWEEDEDCYFISFCLYKSVPVIVNGCEIDRKIKFSMPKGMQDKQKEKAEAGDVEAQYKLGERYFYGRDVPKDYKEAVKWYLKAANQGHMNAQYDLGFMYLYGIGVHKDIKESVKCYLQAAERGHADAQFKLYVMYSDGDIVPEDKEKAKYWLNKSMGNE